MASKALQYVADYKDIFYFTVLIYYNASNELGIFLR